MAFEILIPTFSGEKQINVEQGSSVVFVGANGTGKTRLATHIENLFNFNAHRISAHRAQLLNPSVAKISEEKALLGLRIGYNESTRHYTSDKSSDRRSNRWQGSGATALLNDFDFLIQALFAEQANKSLETHKKVRSGDSSSVEPTQFECLLEIWERLLPHRNLHISGDNILVSVSGEEEYVYSGAGMSDGERAIFYMIGQALVAEDSSLIIFDEPELHIHRSMMAKLWDEIEAVRPDCAFVLITHDLDFAASRVAQKYVVRDYKPTPAWNIEEVPQDSGFDEELVTLILGSRKPILFVEGAESSLDKAIYRCCFPEWTVIPKGSCKDVIHSVRTMRHNKGLTRITCSGIVDADDNNEEDIEYLSNLGIATLPVSEIENIILLPEVSRAIAENEGYKNEDLEICLKNLSDDIFRTIEADKKIDKIIVDHCRRRIDQFLKKIDLKESITVDSLFEDYTRITSSLNINEIAQSVTDNLHSAVDNRDLSKFLIHYRNKKELMNLAAQHLRKCKLDHFESWLVRILMNNQFPEITKAIRKNMPNITAM